jgi:hypothetical protein
VLFSHYQVDFFPFVMVYQPLANSAVWPHRLVFFSYYSALCRQWTAEPFVKEAVMKETAIHLLQTQVYRDKEGFRVRSRLVSAPADPQEEVEAPTFSDIYPAPVPTPLPTQEAWGAEAAAFYALTLTCRKYGLELIEANSGAWMDAEEKRILYTFSYYLRPTAASQPTSGASPP